MNSPTRGEGTVEAGVSDVYYDMYSVEINADPYPVYRRLRDEAPIYYNDQHDFFAVSRFEDVEKGLLDAQTYISGKGAILEIIKADIDIPPGVIIFEDPPTHTIHRRLLSRAFTPRRVAELEPKIREFCAHSLDHLVGADGFDFIADFGAQMPMRVISMLLGIPESDQEAVRDHVDTTLRTKEGEPMQVSSDNFVTGERFAEYVDWRVDHPSDDIMTELLNVEFVDETGATRKLRRTELLTYIEVLAGAGNETTTRLIGWTAKVLAEHPDQRADLVKDPSLIPAAVEEVLRFESPAPHVGRCIARQDLVVRDMLVPEGSVMLFLLGSANRDDRKFPDGDTFDVHREVSRHLTFGNGIHLCMGSALARMEGRIALEELLVRIPEWDIDMEHARLSPTSTVRGWETLPALVP
jgi:cytochrome P450